MTKTKLSLKVTSAFFLNFELNLLVSILLCFTGDEQHLKRLKFESFLSCHIDFIVLLLNLSHSKLLN
jgi:hypothetical protein